MVCQQEGAEPCNEGSSGNGDDEDDMLQADGATGDREDSLTSRRWALGNGHGNGQTTLPARKIDSNLLQRWQPLLS